MASTRIEVTPFSAALGALISGVDLARPLSDRDFGSMRQAFLDHGVIFLHDPTDTEDGFML